LFPERLDDYIAGDNPVRVIDVFVDELDLNELGFDGMQPEVTGRPGYHPASLLKIYIYGYLNRIQSSRRLERETQRNVELIWLTGRLTPDFKTIADFRKDNGKAIRSVCREFVVLCRELNLFSEAIVAIDGSKFKAVNNRDKNFTDRKLKARMQQLEESIARYMTELDRADREPALVTEARVEHIKEKVATVKNQMRQLKQIGKQMAQAPDGQISLTDPDDLALHKPRARLDDPQVLVIGLPQMPDESAMHTQSVPGELPGGSTKRYSTRCRNDSTAHPRLLAYAVRPSSTPSARSKHGWGRRTS
jgi:transposase